jgi:hypothetical protein
MLEHDIVIDICIIQPIQNLCNKKDTHTTRCLFYAFIIVFRTYDFFVINNEFLKITNVFTTDC